VPKGKSEATTPVEKLRLQFLGLQEKLEMLKIDHPTISPIFFVAVYLHASVNFFVPRAEKKLPILKKNKKF
jgi:hypothetical protein